MTHPPINQTITFFYTRDLETTAQFYEGVIGLELLIDQGSCKIYRASNDGWIGFCQRDEVPDRSDGVIFTIVTQEVDTWHQLLIERGINFEKSPSINPKYKIYHCFLRDPNGYLIEIQRFMHEQ